MRDSLVGDGRLFEPEIILPAQYFSVLRKSAPEGPESLLVLAMLQDALECFQKYRFATDENGRELYEDARDWIDSDDRKWPFSYENVCGILKIDPDYVRQRLRRWADQAEAQRRRAKVVSLTSRVACEELASVTAKAS
jgi:hypothetical protein